MSSDSRPAMDSPSNNATPGRLNDEQATTPESERRESALSALLDRLAQHHPPTYEHGRRVASLARQIAIRLGMSKADIRAAFGAGLLHDIGHLMTPIDLLEHSGPLAPDDWQWLHEHTADGHALLSGLVFDPRILACARDHHEQPDGGGYPEGLDLREPITALVAVADRFDTLTVGTGNHAPTTRAQALASIRSMAGSRLDLAMCAALFDLCDEPWDPAPPAPNPGLMPV